MVNDKWRIGSPFTDFSPAHARISTFRPASGRVAQKPIFCAVVISIVTVVYFQTLENHKNDAKVLEEVQKATKYKISDSF